MSTLAKQLLGETWGTLLSDEFDKEYMSDINMFLKEERTRKIIYPTSDKQIFSVFRDTPFDSIKVVIIGQDPYHDGSYNGRAFGNKDDTLRLSPSLRNILKEVEDDVGDGLILDQDITLKNWQNQGVFLINTSLTVESGNPGSHSNIGWQDFTSKALQWLTVDQIPKVFILWGKHAKDFYRFYALADEHHLIIDSPHPSPLSAYRGFFGSKPFSKANEFLKDNEIKEILW